MSERECFPATILELLRRPCRPRHPYAVPRTSLRCVCTRRRNCIAQLSPYWEYALRTVDFPARNSATIELTHYPPRQRFQTKKHLRKLVPRELGLSKCLPGRPLQEACLKRVTSGCSRLAQSCLLSGADVFDGLSGILVRTHELSSGLRQRTSAAPPGLTSAYLCIPLSSLLMPCAYARTIERRREVFILTATPKGRTSSSQLLSPEARLTIAIVVLQRAPVAFRNL